MTDEPTGPKKIDISEILEEVENADLEEVEFRADEADAEGGAQAAASGGDPEAGSLEQRHLRLRADFENYRRRVRGEMEERRLLAEEKLVGDLLPILDNLERALSVPGEGDPFRDGVSMIHRQFGEILQQAGLSPVEAQGRPFDPEIHEAVGREASDEYPANTVIDEIMRGYRFHGRLLRPSMVRVSFSPEAGEVTAAPAERPDDGVDSNEDGRETSAAPGSWNNEEEAAE